MNDKVVLEVSGSIAVITNNNPEKRNAFDDDMDVRLFEILAELVADQGRKRVDLAMGLLHVQVPGHGEMTIDMQQPAVFDHP